ncbi:hypothetical protein V5O48_003638 [Marasmius crinis-equi]|uniref:Uncharacterized protein n=1 Tax=Marasmius crinis-equi TaxID=585013 RepID=A0ABR3FSD2_9AGAR
MVASNPLFRGGMSVKRKFAATVINDIWVEMIFFTLIATMVSVVDQFTDVMLAFEPNLLTVMGTVLALVISFRTSSAYERYQEGRRTWTNIMTFSRNMAQLIWLHVPNDRPEQEGKKKITYLESIMEKKTIINLIQAFGVSVKHYLRGENGVYYEDLYPLVCFLPRYNDNSQIALDMLPMWHASEDGEYPYSHGKERSFSEGHRDDDGTRTLIGDPEGDLEAQVKYDIDTQATKKAKRASLIHTMTLPNVPTHRPLRPAKNPPRSTVYDYFPFLKLWKVIKRVVRKKCQYEEVGTLRNPRKPRLADSNVPLEITLYLHRYIDSLLKANLVHPAIANGLVNTMAAFQDNLSNLERIRNTPLPFAYQAHLRMTLWLYLFFLPFQIWKALGWLTIPATTFASFMFLGFLEIGQEIENPFNYDLNDLDLDNFCLSIQRELHEITAHCSPEPEEFIYNEWNQPFAPADRRTAEVILKNGTETESYHNVRSGDVEPGVMSLRRTLLQAWKDVDVHTRE